MELDEQLSRLVDGDLPEADAVALRRRIAGEPEVAERYGEMLALVTRLGELPEELDAPVVRRRVPVWAAAGWLLAAAAIVIALLPSAPGTTVQATGMALYDGLHQVQAGDVTVYTDGSVGIRVEPRPQVVRVPGQEDSMKAMSHAIAAAAGALVTVTVYEGSASIQGAEDATTVALEAGDTRSFGPTSRSAGAPVVRIRGAGPPDEARVAELEEELDRVREELGQERFAKILMKGQLEAERGVPTEWPEDVSPRMSPEGFPDALAELVAQIPDVELVQTDCQEYPCLGALRYVGEDASMGWGQPIAKKIGAWAEEGLGENVNLSIANIVEDDGDDSQRFLVFGAHGEDRSSNTSQRTGRRMEELGSSLMDDAEL